MLISNVGVVAAGYNAVGAVSQSDLSVLGLHHQVVQLGPVGSGERCSPARFVDCYC